MDVSKSIDYLLENGGDVIKNRFLGLRNGGGLMVLVNTCQALLGYGDDDEVKPFIETSYKAFESVLQLDSLEDITIFRPELKRKNNAPYIEEDTYFPCQYHLETLAHTSSWRNAEKIDTIVESINYHDKIMKDDNVMQIKIGSRIDVVRKSAEIVQEALSKEGYLQIDFDSAYQKQRYKAGLKYPGPYSEVALEPDHKKDTAIWCELTFWAVQFLDIID